MSVNRDFFILGEPIDTRFGKVRFLSYLEYLMNIQDVNLISMNTLHIYYNFKENIEKLPISKEQKKELLDELKPTKKMKLFDYIKKDKQFKDAYFKMFKMVLVDLNIDVIDAIFDDEKIFMEFRSLFMEMNMVHEEEVNENETIQQFIQNSKKAKAANAGKNTLSDLISSVAVGAGYTFREVKEMTVLQVHAAYYRIAALKNYDASIIWATIPTD